MTTKEKLKNIVEKEKVVNSSTNAMGFISRAVREIYPSIRNKPAENSDFKKVIQVARRCYQKTMLPTHVCGSFPFTLKTSPDWNKE